MRFKALKDFSHSGVNIKQDQYFYPREVGFTKASLEFLEKKGKIYKVSDIENPNEDVNENKKIPLVVMVDQNTMLQNATIVNNNVSELPNIQPVRPTNNVNTSNSVFGINENEELSDDEYNAAAFNELVNTIENKSPTVTSQKAKYNSKTNLKELQSIAINNGISITDDMTRKDILQLLKANNI